MTDPSRLQRVMAHPQDRRALGRRVIRDQLLDFFGGLPPFFPFSLAISRIRSIPNLLTLAL